MAQISLPPMAALDAAAARLVERTPEAQRLIDKAIYFLGKGVEIVSTAGGFLIPSSDRSTVYRLDNVRGCSCKGGTKHGQCYHAQILAIVEEAQRYTMPALRPPTRRNVTHAQAMAEINELF